MTSPRETEHNSENNCVSVFLDSSASALPMPFILLFLLSCCLVNINSVQESAFLSAVRTPELIWMLPDNSLNKFWF